MLKSTQKQRLYKKSTNSWRAHEQRFNPTFTQVIHRLPHSFWGQLSTATHVVICRLNLTCQLGIFAPRHTAPPGSADRAKLSWLPELKPQRSLLKWQLPVSGSKTLSPSSPATASTPPAAWWWKTV